jgi:hypothetical protein
MVASQVPKRERLGGSVRAGSQDPLRGRVLALATFSGLAALALLAVAEMYEGLGAYPQAEWFISGMLGLLIIGVHRWILRVQWLSPALMYMFIFWAFHFGLVFPAAMIPGVLDNLPEWTIGWLSHGDVSLAAVLCLLFLMSFCCGFAVVLRTKRPAAGRSEVERSRHLCATGWIVLVIGFGFMVANIMAHGIGVFWLSYDEFFLLHNVFSWSIVIMAYGLLLQIAGGRTMRAVMVTSLWSYVPFALLAFGAGARTAPLFTVTVLLTLLAKRGLRVPGLGVCLGIAVLLSVTATVREFRGVGILSTLETAGQIEVQSPLSGIVELGGSLAPVVATIDDMRNADFFFGETYVYPFVRLLELLAGRTRPDEYSDPRFVAATVADVHGSIGYSTVAEAYVNGGAVGVILFAVLWGAGLSLLERTDDTPYGLAVLGAVLIPMMINVRNSFIYVPAWIFLGLFPLVISWVLERHRDHSWR